MFAEDTPLGPLNLMAIIDCFRNLAKVLHGAGCALNDIQLAMHRAALAIHIDRYSDPDGSMSEEVFSKMSALITQTLMDAMRLSVSDQMDRCYGWSLTTR